MDRVSNHTDRNVPSGTADAGASVARPSVLGDWTRALAATAGIAAAPTRTLPILIEDLAASHGDAPALLSDAECFTYAQLDAQANRFARWASHAGLRRGDVVALLMENRPDYVAVWLGLTKAGIAVAMLNTNLRGEALAHCVRAASPKAAIVSAYFIEAWRGAGASMPTPDLWPYGVDVAGHKRIDASLEALSGASLPADRVMPTIADRALLIYTSGTTGLPKAANVSHGRVLSWALWFAGMLDTGPDDRMYDCLPLYHSVGGVVAVGALLSRGGSVVIAPNFSASRFWRDIRRWDCTLAQYIGELCRYLQATPVQPDESTHKLRAFCGNGLRADVWQPFAVRFAIPRIVEFYAASEGTFSLYNMEGEPGAIGRVPGFLRHRFPAALVRHDEGLDAPARGPNGLCIRTGQGEPGEAIGRISAKDADFEGYTDRAASEAKILRDVFAVGDAWVRTGDLMRIDARGFWYFVDRIGDTFRWKGENVATCDVVAALAAWPGVRDACVYGVRVPHADGRAGMAAMTVTSAFTFDGLAAHLDARLPAYARPLFLRLVHKLEVTGTFKHQTRALQDDGFDPTRVTDTLFVLDAKRGVYEVLSAETFDAISSGALRL